MQEQAATTTAGVGLYVLEMMRDKCLAPRLVAINPMLDLGCCYRCVMRFINQRTFALYRQTEEVPLVPIQHPSLKN